MNHNPHDVRWNIGAFILCAALLAVMLFTSLKPVPTPHHETPTAYGAARSSQWPKVRAAYLKGHPVCEACGAAADVEVHHVQPFHERPELELDPTNFITLCRDHHLTLGHRCDDGKKNWSCGNPNVRTDAATELMQRYYRKDWEP